MYGPSHQSAQSNQSTMFYLVYLWALLHWLYHSSPSICLHQALSRHFGFCSFRFHKTLGVFNHSVTRCYADERTVQPKTYLLIAASCLCRRSPRSEDMPCQMANKSQQLTARSDNAQADSVSHHGTWTWETGLACAYGAANPNTSAMTS